MKLNKKLLLSLGSVASAALPIATVVSCGSELVKDDDGNVLMSYTSGNKTVYFNFNKEESEQVDTSTKQLKQFLPTILDTNNGSPNIVKLDRDVLIDINDAFQKASDPRYSNVDKLQDGDVMHIVFTGQLQKESSYRLKTGEGFAKRPIIRVNLTMEIDYIYHNQSELTYPLMRSAGKDGIADSTNLDQRDKERVKIRSNFLNGLVYGIDQYGLFTSHATVEQFFPKHGELVKPSDGTVLGDYVSQDISAAAFESLAVNANPSIKNVFTQTPRNYETTVTLPHVDLTGYFVDKPHAKSMIGGLDKIQISGDSKNGFHFVVPKNTSLSAKANVLKTAKDLAPANTMQGFFKGTPTITTAWKGGTEYNNAAATETTVVVTATGQDWNGNSIHKSYEVLVTPTV